MLIKCPDCGNEVSDTAFACPVCGAPVRQIVWRRKLRSSLCSIYLSGVNFYRAAVNFVKINYGFACALLILAVYIVLVGASIVWTVQSDQYLWKAGLTNGVPGESEHLDLNEICIKHGFKGALSSDSDKSAFLLGKLSELQKEYGPLMRYEWLVCELNARRGQGWLDMVDADLMRKLNQISRECDINLSDINIRALRVLGAPKYKRIATHPTVFPLTIIFTPLIVWGLLAAGRKHRSKRKMFK